jgi:hypothetical protein
MPSTSTRVSANVGCANPTDQWAMPPCSRAASGSHRYVKAVGTSVTHLATIASRPTEGSRNGP